MAIAPLPAALLARSSQQPCCQPAPAMLWRKGGHAMDEKRIRAAVVGVDLFEAVSAIVGAVGLIAGFMAIPLSILSGTPFADFTVPALLLGVVVGGSALVAAIITAFGPPRFGPLASAIAGTITVGWLIIEMAMIGLGSWAQVV